MQINLEAQRLGERAVGQAQSVTCKLLLKDPNFLEAVANLIGEVYDVDIRTELSVETQMQIVLASQAALAMVPLVLAALED